MSVYPADEWPLDEDARALLPDQAAEDEFEQAVSRVFVAQACAELLRLGYDEVDVAIVARVSERGKGETWREIAAGVGLGHSAFYERWGRLQHDLRETLR